MKLQFYWGIFGTRLVPLYVCCRGDVGVPGAELYLTGVSSNIL